MKCLYATDLDNTFIYSHRFLAEYNVDPNAVCCIERLNGKNINYMGLDVRERLKSLSMRSDILFIPITTRRLEQFKRIDLGVTPEYAVVANGGVILHNNTPIAEWSDFIQDNINYTERDKLIAVFRNCKSLLTDIILCDNCFLFFKLSDSAEFIQLIDSLSKEFPNWTFSCYSKKCYAFPDCCSKGNALNYLKNKCSPDFVIASGDSALDCTMLDIADLAIVPKHSSLHSLSYTYVDGGVLSPLATMNILFSKL